MDTHTFAVTGMRCVACGLLIDASLEDGLPGVARAETSVRAGRTTVRTDGTVAPAEMIAVIEHAGYRATLLT